MVTPDMDMGAVSRIALPTGREYDRCLSAFESTYGIEAPEFDGRCLIAEADGRQYVRIKGKDVPAYVASGFVDVGLTGTDVCEEQIPEDTDGSNLLYRTIGKPMCSFNVLLPAKSAHTVAARLGSPEREPVLVATSYPGFLNRCVQRARAAGTTVNVTVSPFKPAGSLEIAPVLGISEAVADIVESGDTAYANDLTIGLKLADVSPAVVYRDPSKAPVLLNRQSFGVDHTLATRAAQVEMSGLTSYTIERLRDPNKAVKEYGEEGAEFLEAVISGKTTATNELADLVFAGLVLSRAKGGNVRLADVIHILEERNAQSSLRRT